MPANKTRILPNSVALAGEFAVLSRLALCNYDASLTLGQTKNIDILVSNPKTNKLYQLEVKTKLEGGKKSNVSDSELFGHFLTGWMMSEKHESIFRPELWYCFVTIDLDWKARFFIVPSSVVAKYVLEQHRFWLAASRKHKDNPMRLFRIGFKNEKYRIPTPTAERYEDNWEFKQ
ncbi:MAG TPA: hypothetical protein VN836_00990 [Verrucomicrobiae bacterium]|nr:hypothetical protein [Verrucomicrobiae bacterium]